MTLTNPIHQKTTQTLSSHEFVQQMQHAQEDEEQFELVAGNMLALPAYRRQMQIVRLLQWQIQHLLSTQHQTNNRAERNIFETSVRPLVRLDDWNCFRPAIVVQRNSSATDKPETTAQETIWVIDVEAEATSQNRIEIYAKANIPNYWVLNINSIELHAYQQLKEAGGYLNYRVLQVGDRHSPQGIPLTVMLQDPVPLHFMTRTLNGQQTYQSAALPLSFS